MLRGNLGRNKVDAGQMRVLCLLFPGELILLAGNVAAPIRCLKRLADRVEVLDIEIECFLHYFADSVGYATLLHNTPKCFPKPVGVRKGHSYPQGTTDYAARKAYRSAVAEAEYTVHGHKHLKASTEAEAMAFSRGGGAAQYLPEVSNSGLEKIALQKGYVVERGGGYYAYIQFDRTIGYNNGNATTWIRAELSGDAYHGHPVLESDLPQAVRKHFGL